MTATEYAVRRAPRHHLLAATGIVVPALAALLYILTFGVNTAFSDHVRLAPFFGAMDRGALTLQMAFALHNEHRILFPRLTSLALGRFTQFNTVVEMVFGWGLLVIALALLWRAWRRSVVGDATLVGFVPVSAILFGWRQHEVFLRGDSLPTYMSVVGVLASTFLLTSAHGLGGRFALALAAATFASFSYLNGLLAWPIGAALLASRLRAEPRPLVAALAIWLVVGTCVTLTYFAGYVKPGHHPPLTHLFQSPIVALHHFLIAAGGPLGSDPHAALGMGAAILALQLVAVAVAWRGWISTGRQPSFGVWLIAFSVTSLAMITVGRSGFGAAQAFSSRYTPFAIQGIIGAYLVFADAPVVTVARSAKTALLVLVGVGVLTVYSSGLTAGRAERHNRLIAAYVLRTYRLQTDDRLTRFIGGLSETVRSDAAVFERLKLNVFAGAPFDQASLPRGTGGLMSLDVVNGRGVTPGVPIVLENESEVVLQGWAVDADAKRPAADVFAIIDGSSLVVPAGPGGPRPDVADHFRIPTYEHAGFTITFAAALLSPGMHTVRFSVLSADGHHVTPQPAVLLLKRTAAVPTGPQ